MPISPSRYSDEPVYRSPTDAVQPSTAADNKSDRTDQGNYDTLRIVQKTLNQALDDIDKWHAFSDPQMTGDQLKHQLIGHSVAYEILSPVVDAVNATIERIDSKYRGGV